MSDNTAGKRIMSLMIVAMALNSFLLPLNSCAPKGQDHSLAGGGRGNSKNSSDWAAYKAVSPFVPFRMWALSLPKYGRSTPSCASDNIFAELTGMIAKADAINASIQDPSIHQHIDEVVRFWREVIREQPSLNRKANTAYYGVEQAATESRDLGFRNSTGTPIERGHAAVGMGLAAAFAASGMVDEVFRPHVARYAPRALKLARRERELDRRFHYGGDQNRLLVKNISELEETVSAIRN